MWCFCFVCWVKCYNRFVIVLVCCLCFEVSFEGGFGFVLGGGVGFVFCDVFG